MGPDSSALRTLGAHEHPVLLRLPISHYCRKAEWGLTHAGIPYRILDLPLRDMLHKIRRANPGEGTVPILVTQDGIVFGSHGILRWADAHRAPGTPPLYPPHDAPSIEAWEADMDRDAGPAVRREAYRVLVERPEVYADSAMDRARLILARPRFRRIMRHYQMDHYRDDTRILRGLIERTAATLAARSEGGFLFGDRVSAADVATAALMQPLLAIGRTRGLAGDTAWEVFASHVARTKPARLTRVGKRPVRARDWKAFDALNRR